MAAPARPAGGAAMRGDFPLHIADTKRHVAEWERRKAALVDFVVEFADGRRITVGVDCAPDDLTPGRGIFLARCAYSMKQSPPPIVAARFEFHGEVLAIYDIAALGQPEAAR
jgi:hypothetical protein